ncbi:MAG: amidase domain-containing protein [Bacillus sp. (in: firmicutes)]
MKKQLQELLQRRCEEFLSIAETRACQKTARKTHLMKDRDAEIVHVKAKGNIFGRNRLNDEIHVNYKVHLQYFIKQGKSFYIEEELEERKAVFHQGMLTEDEEVNRSFEEDELREECDAATSARVPFIYDRLQAVQYADRWWNEYNPAYQQFENDCTNFISQCLRAGGAPMRGAPNRSKGWWYSGKSWSYSWSVAHAFYLYLKNSRSGLRAIEVSSPEELMLGDVICYDFEGDGRFNHNTIVTGKDAYGMPLVNAHTTDSRLRYWAYEDSSAYTPQIQYRFFHIVDDNS